MYINTDSKNIHRASHLKKNLLLYSTFHQCISEIFKKEVKVFGLQMGKLRQVSFWNTLPLWLGYGEEGLVMGQTQPELIWNILINPQRGCIWWQHAGVGQGNNLTNEFGNPFYSFFSSDRSYSNIAVLSDIRSYTIGRVHMPYSSNLSFHNSTWEAFWSNYSYSSSH